MGRTIFVFHIDITLSTGLNFKKYVLTCGCCDTGTTWS